MLLLERDDHLGGAAVSAQAFEGVDARLSRYSYLVSLLPQRIIDDLGLDVRLVRRRYSSYTPDPADPSRGLLVDREADARGIRCRVRPRRRRGRRRRRGTPFYAETARVAERSSRRSPSRCRPAPRRARWSATSGPGTSLVEQPLGERSTRASRRPRARRRRDRRPHRHLHRPRRPVARREPLLPVPRDRRRHRRLGRAGRRHGRRHGRARPGRARGGRRARDRRRGLAVDPAGRVRYVRDGVEHVVEAEACSRTSRPPCSTGSSRRGRRMPRRAARSPPRPPRRRRRRRRHDRPARPAGVPPERPAAGAAGRARAPAPPRRARGRPGQGEPPAHPAAPPPRLRGRPRGRVRGHLPHQRARVAARRRLRHGVPRRHPLAPARARSTATP